jgi:colanic acid/amylovoran biosynthesis protein
MKIIVTNTVILNTGDAAILKGLIKILDEHFDNKNEYVIYDLHPEASKKYYPNLNLKKSIYFQTVTKLMALEQTKIIRTINRKRLVKGTSLWKANSRILSRLLLTSSEINAIRNYEKADLVISTGGTYLVENYDLESRIIDFLLTILLNKKLIFFTQSLGPFRNERNISEFRFIFNYSQLILLRDNYSRENLKKINVKTENIFQFSDAAFALADIDYIYQNNQIEKLNKKLHVAISVRNWPHFKCVDPQEGQRNYLNSIQVLSIFLIRDMGCDITYISTCQGIPEYYLDDAETADLIFQNLPEDVCISAIVDRKHYPPEGLIEKLKNFDFVIATRLHMAILAMCVGVPVIPIAYEFKTSELFEKLGLSKWVIDIEKIDPIDLIHLVNDFREQLQDIRNILAKEVEKEFLNAMEAGALIKSKFK